MIGALLLIWIGFHILSGGLFLTPRNLWNLSVQTSSVAVMATGMVLVIVTRNIDLSVGSILGFVGMIMGVAQAQWLPQVLGFGHPAIWIISLALGIVCGAAIGGAARCHHRLSRRAGLHRHAGRPSRLARRRLVGDQRPARSPRWTPPSA
jgi:ABC-type xylose transport system permease subunit